MNKTSGFRKIEFKEVECKYYDRGFTETEYCYNGFIYIESYSSFNVPIPYMSDRRCKKCSGTGTIDKAESKIE